MKKILIIAVLVSIVSSSCEEFLSTTPIDKVAAVNYFTDEEGLTQGLAAVYDPLSSTSLYKNLIWLHLEGSTDEGYYARSSNQPFTSIYTHNSGDPQVRDLWSTLYTGANRANDLIANIKLPTMDERKRDIILGEALFLRGYYNFILVSRFGDVPMKLTPTTSPEGVQLPKTPAAQIYAQVIKDMTEAEGKVATSTSYGYSSRVSKTVVQGILARVCLQMAGYPLLDTAKYADALSWANKVVNSGEHALNETFNAAPEYNLFNPSRGYSATNNAYRQIFINLAQDIYDVKECMWEAEFKGNLRDGAIREEGNVGQTNGITMGSVMLTDTGRSFGFTKGTPTLYNLYGVGDLRRDWALTTFTYNTGLPTWGIFVNPIAANPKLAATKVAIANTPANTATRDCGKWRREYQLVSQIGPLSAFGSSINFPILRYADVLLMRAEAANYLNGPTTLAYDAVNRVRRRGYGLPINVVSAVADLPAGLSKADFQLELINERSRELCFEGVRKMDLIRWGIFSSRMKAYGTEMSALPTPTGNRYGSTAGVNVGAAGPDSNNKFLLFPIPDNEISTNKALEGKNNPGW